METFMGLKYYLETVRLQDIIARKHRKSVFSWKNKEA